MITAILMPKYNATYHMYYISMAFVGNLGFLLEFHGPELVAFLSALEILNVTRVFYDFQNVVLRFIIVVML